MICGDSEIARSVDESKDTGIRSFKGRWLYAKRYTFSSGIADAANGTCLKIACVISNGRPSNCTLEACSSRSMGIGSDVMVLAGYGMRGMETTVYG